MGLREEHKRNFHKGEVKELPSLCSEDGSRAPGTAATQVYHADWLLTVLVLAAPRLSAPSAPPGYLLLLLYIPGKLVWALEQTVHFSHRSSLLLSSFALALPHVTSSFPSWLPGPGPDTEATVPPRLLHQLPHCVIYHPYIHCTLSFIVILLLSLNPGWCSQSSCTLLLTCLA